MLKIEQILRDEDGKIVLNDSFDSITIIENQILVEKNGFMGFYNITSFEQILKCEWDKLKFEGMYVIAYKDPLYAVFDVNGNKILDHNWDKVKLYGNGILVTKNGKQGFYDYNGNVILECIWKRIECYHQSLIAYMGNGTKGKFFDHLGNEK